MNSLTPKELHDSMQAAYDRIQMSSHAKNCLPEIAAFAEYIFGSSILEKDLEVATQDLRTALVPIVKLKNPSFKELKAAQILIANYKELIPALSIYLKECEDIEANRLAMSWEMAIYT